MTQTDRARSALWHARNRAYREWVESNRELLEYLASSPDVPEHLRPAGPLPPRSVQELAETGRPDAISRPDAHLSVRPDATSRPDVGTSEGTGRPVQADENRIQNPHQVPADEARPTGRTLQRGAVGGVFSRFPECEIPPTAPHDPAGRVDRVATVAELVAKAGVPLVLSSADKRAIRSCTAEPSVIAEAFTAAARREWGGDFLHQNLSVRLVIQRLSGYLAWKASLATNGQPARHQGRSAAPAPTAYEHDPWRGRRPPIDQAEVDRFYAETGRGQ